MTTPTCPTCATPVQEDVCTHCAGLGSRSIACMFEPPTADDCRECVDDCECIPCEGQGSWFVCPACGWRSTSVLEAFGIDVLRCTAVLCDNPATCVLVVGNSTYMERYRCQDCAEQAVRDYGEQFNARIIPLGEALLPKK